MSCDFTGGCFDLAPWKLDTWNQVTHAGGGSVLLDLALELALVKGRPTLHLCFSSFFTLIISLFIYRYLLLLLLSVALAGQPQNCDVWLPSESRMLCIGFTHKTTKCNRYPTYLTVFISCCRSRWEVRELFVCDCSGVPSTQQLILQVSNRADVWKATLKGHSHHKLATVCVFNARES